ncbi:MAG TPA: aldehyde ferredoxin oxidoreductase N-terminal domain-containing protein [Syntrophomonadaceae bacterium]|nr:aldehyde ferredoxin oxidoreductase N-terminal domain-containing protein [Syntrophomonadaceae bacterium]
MNGWMGSIIRVNLTNETIKTEPLNMEDAKLYLGGRGLGSKIYTDEVEPKVDALSPENKLIFMTGPLTGTPAASAGRYEVVTKSPLSDTIGAFSSGGHFGPELKYAGFDGIIFEGKAKKPLYLYINNDHSELRDASHIWSKEVPATTEELLKETEEDAKVACIGTAGEKPISSAAVMNSKNLKAIVVKGTQSIKVAKKKPFLDSCMDVRAKLKANPVMAGGLSTERNRGCIGCSVGCGRAGQRFGEGPEYEKSSQHLTAVADSVGICQVTTFAVGLPEIAQMVRTCTGIDYTDEEVLQIGERIWNLEKGPHFECVKYLS